jgi:hypothetical protein
MVRYHELTITTADQLRNITSWPLGVNRTLLVYELLYQAPRRNYRRCPCTKFESEDLSILLSPLHELEVSTFLGDLVDVAESDGLSVLEMKGKTEAVGLHWYCRRARWEILLSSAYIEEDVDCSCNQDEQCCKWKWPHDCGCFNWNDFG